MSASQPSTSSEQTRSTSPKAVVIYSGGMDSYTILNKAKAEGYDLFALTFDYGQKHDKEIEFASNACKALDINHKIIDNRLAIASRIADMWIIDIGAVKHVISGCFVCAVNRLLEALCMNTIGFIFGSRF